MEKIDYYHTSSSVNEFTKLKPGDMLYFGNIIVNEIILSVEIFEKPIDLVDPTYGYIYTNAEFYDKYAIVFKYDSYRLKTLM